MSTTPDIESEADEKTLAEIFKPLHAMIRVIRDRRKISIAEAIQKFGGPGIEREYRKVVKEMHDELDAADDPPVMAHELGGEAGGA